MSNKQPIELQMQIEMDGGDSEDIDRLTRQLLGELRDQEVESADLVILESAAPGTKAADPVTLGAIALAVLPAVLPKIVEFVQSWMMRGPGRTVKFKGKVGGQEIEFEGSPQDLQKMLATFNSQKSGSE